jgi:hypothetical protein
MTEIHPQKPLAYDNARRAAANLERIKSVAEKLNLHIVNVVWKEKIFLLLTHNPDEVPSEKIHEIIDYYSKIEKISMGNSCYTVAKLAVNKGLATGIIGADHNVGDVIGWKNHFVNFVNLKEGDMLSFDVTAAENMDNSNGNYHTIGIQAADLAQLLRAEEELCGGQWYEDEVKELLYEPSLMSTLVEATK